MQLFFNGVHAGTGEYLRSPVRLEELAHRFERRERPDRDSYRMWGAEVDPGDLSQTGWAVVFGPSTSPEIRDALQPLLEHRQAQAARRNRRYYRELKCEPHETSASFLSRHGRQFGPADPNFLPYYLLLVASPEEVPFEFQYQLDVQYGVGRLWFDTVEEFRCYAESVVNAEEGAASCSRDLVFFAPDHPGDPMTRLSAGKLAGPLARGLDSNGAGWRIQTCVGRQATKDHLVALLSGGKPPALLFTAGHGIGLDAEDEGQEGLQGALLCQGWEPGKQSISRAHIVSASDLEEARPHGLVAFLFACFSAGTPQWDSFAHLESGRREAAARRSFIAALPRKLLGQPGGALAIVGHIDQAWPCSFLGEETGAQLQTFRNTLQQLMRGLPVGAAMEYFGQRYAEIAAELSFRMEPVVGAGFTDGMERVQLWLANNDARSYIVLGDPAVRLTGSAPKSPKSIPSPAGTVWRGL